MPAGPPHGAGPAAAERQSGTPQSSSHTETPRQESGDEPRGKGGTRDIVPGGASGRHGKTSARVTAARQARAPGGRRDSERKARPAGSRRRRGWDSLRKPRDARRRAARSLEPRPRARTTPPERRAAAGHRGPPHEPSVLQRRGPDAGTRHRERWLSESGPTMTARRRDLPRPLALDGRRAATAWGSR